MAPNALFARLAGLAVLVLLVIPVAGAADNAPLARALAQLTPHYPPSTEWLATTDGDTYLNNLSAQIASQRGHSAATPAAKLGLAQNLYQRWRIVGAADDLAAANSALTVVLLAQPENARALRLAAAIAMAEHRFDAAGHFLQRAGGWTDANPEQQRRQRELQLATGMDLDMPNLDSLGSQDWPDAAIAARTLTDLGRPDLATAVLRDAMLRYRDTNPYPLAWLSVQQGIVFLRHGQHHAAQRFFAAAVERLPSYTLALEHLGEVELALGNLDAAHAAYGRVIENDRSALFLWQHGKVLTAKGDTEGGAAMRREALEQLQAAVERAPLLMAGHGVSLLAEAGEHEQALRLARLNAEQRNTWRAAASLAEAAWAKSQSDEACAAYKRAQSAAELAPEVIALTEEIGVVCQAERA